MSGAAEWVQAGGVVAFATAVLFQLREIKPALIKLSEALGEVKSVMAALLERERIRTERRRDPSGPHPMPKPEWSDGESTDLHELIDMQRRGKVKTPARGVRLPRPGTHHDE